MENTDPKELQNSPSAAVKTLCALFGLVTFVGVFAANFYFGFEATIPLIAGGFVGMVAGVFAAAVANKRGRKSMANASLVLCTIARAVGGLILAVPAALLLISITLLAKRNDVQAPTQDVLDAEGERI
jgi:hypothetical protein